MKNHATTQQVTVNAVFRALVNAIKHFFQNGSKRDFERLKNFISS